MLIKLIIGLPGSGKSYFLNEFLDDSWTKIDDPKTTDDPLKDFPLNIDKLAVVDPWFCNKTVLKSAIETLLIRYPNAEFDYVYFKNEPEQCKINVSIRNDGRKVNGFIDMFSKLYEPPDTAIGVYNGNV